MAQRNLLDGTLNPTGELISVPTTLAPPVPHIGASNAIYANVGNDLIRLNATASSPPTSDLQPPPLPPAHTGSLRGSTKLKTNKTLVPTIPLSAKYTAAAAKVTQLLQPSNQDPINLPSSSTSNFKKVSPPVFPKPASVVTFAQVGLYYFLFHILSTY